MDRLDHRHAARLLQSLLKGGLKGLPLLGSGHGGLCAENGVNELLVELVRLPGVEEGVVQIGRPVIKGRVQEAQLRRRHDLPGHAVVELVLPGEVAQLRLAVLHRTHAAEDAAVHVLRIPRLAVPAPAGHVVGVIGHEDQVVALPHVQALDDPLVELLADLAVFQLRLPQSRQEPVLVAVHHLLGGEHHVDEIFAQSPGQGLFQQAQVLLRLLQGHPAQGLVQVGDDLPLCVDITAVDAAHGAPVRLETAAQLPQFLLIHPFVDLAFLVVWISSPLYCKSAENARPGLRPRARRPCPRRTPVV